MPYCERRERMNDPDQASSQCRSVHVLELHAVGIGEEHGVVTLAIRIVGRRVEDRDAERLERAVEAVDGVP
jgi:hypothetical protein